MLTMQQWHDITHADEAKLKETAKQVIGMKIDEPDGKKTDSVRANCKPCIEAAAKRRTFNHKLIKATEPGEVLHSDIIYLPARSMSGKLFMVTYICEATRYKRIYFLSNLTAEELLSSMMRCFSDQWDDIKKTPKRLHSDRGTNYESDLVQEFLRTKECKFTTSRAYNQEQIGLTRKTEEDMLKKAKSLMFEAKAPLKTWTLAMNYACHIMNVLVSSSTGKTPYESFLGVRPNVSRFLKFGAIVDVQISKKKRRLKLNKNAFGMRFVGFKGQITENYLFAYKDYSRVASATSVYSPKKKSDRTRTGRTKVKGQLIFFKLLFTDEDCQK